MKVKKAIEKGNMDGAKVWGAGELPYRYTGNIADAKMP